MGEYTFEEADAGSAERLEAIAAAMDPGTFALLDDIGVGNGWRCADVGAGAGTVVEWLAGRVGPSGCVVATDIDTRWLEGRWGPHVVVRRQDLTVEALEAGEYDLVHTRTVLTHLREWEAALRRLVSAIRPGGWLLVEEPDMLTVGRCYPAEPAVDRFGRGLEELMRRSGGDPHLGLRLPSALVELGLADVDHHVRLSRAEPSAMRAHLDGAVGALVGSGLMSRDEVERVAAYYERTDTVLYGTVIVAAWGRRPAGLRSDGS